MTLALYAQIAVAVYIAAAFLRGLGDQEPQPGDAGLVALLCTLWLPIGIMLMLCAALFMLYATFWWLPFQLGRRLRGL